MGAFCTGDASWQHLAPAIYPVGESTSIVMGMR